MVYSVSGWTWGVHVDFLAAPIVDLADSDYLLEHSQASHQNYLLDLQLGGSPLNLLPEIPYATAAQEENRHRPTGRNCHGEPDGCWPRRERTRVLHRTTIHFWDSSGDVKSVSDGHVDDLHPARLRRDQNRTKCDLVDRRSVQWENGMIHAWCYYLGLDGISLSCSCVLACLLFCETIKTFYQFS